MSTTDNGAVQNKLIGNPGLRRQVSATLVGVALVSVLLLASVNFVFARLLINDSVESQLAAVRDTRVQALEIGADRLKSRVSSLAINPSVAEALVDLAREFDALDGDLTSDQIEDLTTLYDTEVLPPFVQAGVDINSAELVPASAAGRSAQRLYISENPNGIGERDQLDDAGDGSGYSAAHATHHPMLRALLENAGMSDLLLVNFDTGEVVYSTKKRVDLGTNSYTGPYADSGLGRVVEKLTTVAPGNSVLSDTFFYVPTSGEPVFFLAAAVRSGTDLVGALVTEVPVRALTDVMTAGEGWQRLGLGASGESYIVGGDRTLRTETRAWLEDPADYLSRHLAQFDDPGATDLIELIGSPVLVQPVDNAAVTESLDGNQFSGTVKNYLGTKTLAASGPAAVEGVNWAVVVEIDKSESDTALNSLLRRFALVLAILLPAIAIFGVFLARTLTKPAQTLVRSAERIAGGDLDTEISDLGQNELGDLGRQLGGVARQLESQEQAIVDEEQHINNILSALLPNRLVDRVRGGEEAIGDVFDTATVVSITIDDVPSAIANDADLALEVADRLNDETLALAERHGAERIQRSSASEMYLTGLNQDDAMVPDATEFALAAIQLVSEVGAEFGFEFAARAGISTGEVATGVLGNSQLSFGVWGDPTGMAMTLASLALPGQVLADGFVVEQLDRTWDIEELEELAGLADDIQAHVVSGRVDASATATNDPTTSR
ncbi:MAG: adenylate/guanylate cyclase domain-containing protein [Ilumatobacter sp.]|nr:adenylate/guanylate cyclase domain-containing protein [Ilumatobacter sp.]